MRPTTTGSVQPGNKPHLPNSAGGGGAGFHRLRRRLRHFEGPADVWDFLRMGVAVALVPGALSVFGLERVLNRRGTLLAAANPVKADALVERGRRLAIYADYWLRLLRPRNPCLRRSLALFERLRRAGLPVDFCLGIRNDQGLGADEPVVGHAWLELGGRVILEPEALIARHVRTYRYPPREED